MKQHPDPDPIDEAASLWAARADGGGMTASDRAELDAWLDAHPAHRARFTAYQELSDRIELHLDAQVAQSIESTRSDRAIHRRRRRLAIGVLAAAAAIALVFLVARPSKERREIVTRTAERHAATLADGSHVDLNAQTEISVEFRRDERRVHLTRGEAMFTVAKDAMRPFVVETPAGRIRVTGTAFNVRSPGDGQLEVTVLEGTVRVRPPAEGARETAVVPDQQVVIRDDAVTVLTLPPGTAHDVGAWRQGRAIFDETPLRAAVERFAAYHARTIIVDPSTPDSPLGGRFDLADLDGWLDSLESILPIRVSHGERGTVRILPAETGAP